MPMKREGLADVNLKNVGVAVLITDKANLRAKKITRDAERHYVMRKGSNPSKRRNNPKCVFTKLESCNTCEAEMERRNRHMDS